MIVLTEKQIPALIKSLQRLSDKFSLGMQMTELDTLQSPDCSLYIADCFPQRTLSHPGDVGEAPRGAYRDFLKEYAAISQGEFDPQNIKVDSDDYWESLWMEFSLQGQPQCFHVSGVEDTTGYFNPRFIRALNRFAKKIALPGRWIEFSNGDSLVVLYLPEAAYLPFQSLRRKYSQGA